MYPLVISQGKPLEVVLPVVFTLRFFVDPMSLLFATITSFLWMAATIYSVSYMKHEHKPNRFYFFLILTLAFNLGVVLTADLLTLFIFFEGLGFFAYPLVVHSETDEAFRAGTKYLIMTVLGGLSLLFGIFLLYAYTDSLALMPALEKLQHLGTIKFVISSLMIVGFGVKAGMIPVHTWLPDAHPVAPSPASALLSGIMIKAGAYGIIRVVSNLFRPPFGGGEAVEAIEHLWKSTATIGYVVIWIGAITMFLGVIMALLQENSKRMLAFHSISQMGYILMGVGAAAYLGHEGALAFAASIYHVVNHALFKGALFLGVGAVYYQTHELNMYKLGGLWRKMPFVFLFTFVAAAGISGIPLFNGFASKTLLHEAIVEANKHSHLLSLKIVEIIFIITGGGTLCSFMKLITFTFLGKRPAKYDRIKEAPWLMNISLAMLAIFILALGLFPGLLLKTFLFPIAKYWQLPVEELAKVHFFSLESLKGILFSILIGVFIFIVGVRYHLFHIHFPKLFSIDYWYLKLARGFIQAMKGMAVVSGYLNKLIFALTVDMWLPQPVTQTSAWQAKKFPAQKVGETLTVAEAKLSFADNLGSTGQRAGEVLGKTDAIIDKIVNAVGVIGQTLSKLAGFIDTKIIDKIVNAIGIIGQKMSKLAGFFDLKVIDNIINGVGWATKKVGKKLRPLQTGNVQFYGLIMFIAAAILILYFIIFR